MDNFADDSEFPTYSEFRDFNPQSNAYDEDSSLEYAEPTLSTAVPAYYEFETVWRSASVMPQAPNLTVYTSSYDVQSNYDAQPSHKFIEKPSLKKGSALSPSKNSNNIIVQSLPKEVNSFTAPEPPFLLMSTNFEVESPLAWISEQIDIFLGEQQGLSYENVKKECEWKCASLSGSTHSSFQVKIYKSDKEGFHIVEGHRLKGDASSFRSIYSQLKERLSSHEFNYDAVGLLPFQASGSDSFATAFPLSVSSFVPDPAGIAPILNMAKEPNMEAQEESARMICDLSIDETMQPHLCESGCIEILYTLVSTSNSDVARQHAMVALANLSDSEIGKETIFETSDLLPILLKYATNGTYELAEMRRLAVYVLANVTHQQADKVLAVLGGKHVVSSWVDTVDDLQDERLRLQAVRVRESFLPILV
jgi:hypothetical protein